MTKKIVLGSDHGGFELKEKLKNYLKEQSFEIEDMGCFDQNSVHYPKIGKSVAEKVSCGDFPRGILVCGTGMGMSITANRVKGVRAALCQDSFTAKMSRQHNDANILVLGGRVVGDALALEILDLWLNTEFEGGRHQTRIDMIEEIST